MRSVNTVVEDIYSLLTTKEIPEGVDIDGICEAFGASMGRVLREQLKPEEVRDGLRLSSVGKPDRQIYNRFMGIQGEPIDGPTYIKFLYGHITEELVLTLTKLAGHSVTDQQKECYVEGVKGHMDGRIDGVVMDVKSASSFGFKKFKHNRLHEDDAFGYIGQLKAYAHSEGETTYGWLVLEKQNGHLTWLQYDENDTTAPYYDAVNYDIAERVRDLKKLVGSDVVPAICYEPVPEGKSGNMRLATGCAYCDFKYICWPDVQTYYYSTGPKYLTTVVKEPRVYSGNAPLPEGF
jgi:hypothetical protein